MGPGSTPWHKTRPPAGRGAVCTEPHQCTRASRDLRAGGTVGGSTVEVVLPEHCRRYGSQPGCVWRPFWLFWTTEKQAGPKKIFFVKKMGIWQIWPPDGPKSGPIFFLSWYQNLPPGKVTGKGSETRVFGIFTTFGPSEVQIW